LRLDKKSKTHQLTLVGNLDTWIANKFNVAG
jgi:hypothetical protein